MPRSKSVFLTAKFQVHNPSRKKRMVMDRALEEYTHAYRQLLDWASDNRSMLAEKACDERGRYAKSRMMNLLPKTSLLRGHHIHNSARHSVLVDVAGALTAYYELRKETSNTAFPTCRDPSPETFPNALDDFANMIDGDDEEFLRRKWQLLKVTRGAVMPIYFARPDAVPYSRNFSLLRDADTGKYYALLFLLPGRDRSRASKPRGNLRRMGWPAGRDPAGFKPAFTADASAALVLPLAMGNWHVETFLKPCQQSEVNVRSAFLSRSDGPPVEYFVHVNFEFFPVQRRATTYLGVDRGLTNLIALTVCNEKGEIVHQELGGGNDLLNYQKYVFTEYRSRQQRGKLLTGERTVARRNEEVCHRLANRIVAIAKEYRSQVVMEDLKRFKEDKKDSLVLKRAPLMRIEQILAYKLQLAGLPQVRSVPPAYTSRECPKCGYGRGVKGNRVNRPRWPQFRCEQCGYETHADLNGSHNIARRWLEVVNRPRGGTLRTG